jgi:hypothetical protein
MVAFRYPKQCVLTWVVYTQLPLSNFAKEKGAAMYRSAFSFESTIST